MLFGPAAVATVVTAPLLLAMATGLAADGQKPELPQLQWAAVLSNLPIYGTLAITYLLVMPIVWQRRIRFVCRHLVIIGTFNPATVRQTAEDPSVAGEGLIGDFDAV
jgi:hypothetical protein